MTKFYPNPDFQLARQNKQKQFTPREVFLSLNKKHELYPADIIPGPVPVHYIPC